ncbi:MAG: YggS family pyridoxal phosphate-dependent enzyme [Candidatus Omnitrophota bacterium]
MIKQNVDTVLAKISAVCARAGRDPRAVTLIGVTKYSSADDVNLAIAAGLKDIAENRVQAAEEKFPRLTLAERAPVKHLIGHLQSNKVKDAVRLFDMIQSVDSLKLAAEIDKRAAAVGKRQDILVQVDIAREEQKFGVAEEDLEALLVYLDGCRNVRTRGLMAMAPLTGDNVVIRSVFRRLKALFERVSVGRPFMEHVSMGMSGDYEIAIEEGATMVRIGSAIFKGVAR